MIRRLLATLTAGLIGFSPLPAFAQAQPAPAPVAAPLPDADPALWVIRDDDTTIYLFGTFHLLDGRPWFNDEIRTAFDASDELVIEAIIPDNPAELQPIVLRHALTQDGPPLSERLTAEQNAALARALAPAGAPAAAFERFKPWFVAITLANLAAQQLGIDAAQGTEKLLTAAARARNIPIGALETMEFQLSLFDSLPPEQQLAMLQQALDNLDELPRMLAPMLAAWSAGDVERLVEMINQMSADDPAVHDLLFTRRNANWTDWIVERMQRPGTVFLAVGAGHLAGNDSVQTMLAARGIASERVAR
ncbi:MAG: TraB/GumN family protein [Sphingomonas sp.]|nr:TraB/GumN family protein [Sphingomonas sp.]